jgi:hypothetical protein
MGFIIVLIGLAVLIAISVYSLSFLWRLIVGSKTSRVKRGIATALLVWVVIGSWLLIHDSDNHFALWLYSNLEP